MIVINLKNYKAGGDVIDLVQKIRIYYNKAIIAAPTVEIAETVKSTPLQIYAQHVDFREPGKSTGYVLPENLLNAGVTGSLLNHSEHRIPLTEIKKTIKRCNEIGFKLIVCATTLRQVGQIKKLNPYAIAFEDKNLISTGKSITEYDAHEVKKFAELLKGTSIIPLCGAGITSGKDVASAIILGCKGVLVASAVANSRKPEKFLKEVAAVI